MLFLISCSLKCNVKQIVQDFRPDLVHGQRSTGADASLGRPKDKAKLHYVFMT